MLPLHVRLTLKMVPTDPATDQPEAALTREIEAEDCSSWLACHAGTTSTEVAV